MLSLSAYRKRNRCQKSMRKVLREYQKITIQPAGQRSIDTNFMQCYRGSSKTTLGSKCQSKGATIPSHIVCSYCVPKWTSVKSNEYCNWAEWVCTSFLPKRFRALSFTMRWLWSRKPRSYNSSSSVMLVVEKAQHTYRIPIFSVGEIGNWDTMNLDSRCQEEIRICLLWLTLMAKLWPLQTIPTKDNCIR